MERNNHGKSGDRNFLKRRNLRRGLAVGRFCQKAGGGGYCKLRKQHSKGNFWMILEGRSRLKKTFTFSTLFDGRLCTSLISKVEFTSLSVSA